MRVIYMGTPEFAVEPLIKLTESHHELLLVITQPDRMKGRGKKLMPPPVKEVAVERGLEVYQPDRIKDAPEVLERIEGLNPDIIVVCAYGKILPKELLNLPKYGCINIHASILPRWRGASPMQMAILEGDERTGITIMQMSEGLDTGAMLSKEEIEIDGLYYPTLSDKLSKVGADLMLKTLDGIEKGEIKPEPQSENEATYAPIVKKDDGHIRFDEKNASQVERMVRAYEPWPGAYCYVDSNLIKFKAGKALPLNEELWSAEEIEAEPGTIIRADDTGIYIRTKEDIFCLTELQIPGKNWMDTASYLRGHKIDIGAKAE